MIRGTINRVIERVDCSYHRGIECTLMKLGRTQIKNNRRNLTPKCQSIKQSLLKIEEENLIQTT
jgi:hypothetical protein